MLWAKTLLLTFLKPYHQIYFGYTQLYFLKNAIFDLIVNVFNGYFQQVIGLTFVAAFLSIAIGLVGHTVMGRILQKSQPQKPGKF